jgi:hypothetical protein
MAGLTLDQIMIREEPKALVKLGAFLWTMRSGGSFSRKIWIDSVLSISRMDMYIYRIREGRRVRSKQGGWAVEVL